MDLWKPNDQKACSSVFLMQAQKNPRPNRGRGFDFLFDRTRVPQSQAQLRKIGKTAVQPQKQDVFARSHENREIISVRLGI